MIVGNCGKAWYSPLYRRTFSLSAFRDPPMGSKDDASLRNCLSGKLFTLLPMEMY